MYKVDKVSQYYSFKNLLEVMTLLRSKNGCPWDREQSHKTLKNAIIEEAYELVEAINNEDVPNMKEELGDLLLLVVFHSQIGLEEGQFTIDDVLDTVVSKLIRRHPHVFEGDPNIGTDEVLEQWDAIKLEEKAITTVTEDLRLVPKVLPALIKARKVQKKVGKIGFDFPDWQSAFAKIEEEMEEFKEACAMGKNKEIEEEFGDLLLSMVNISRFFELNPENALTNSLEKFINRFEGIETLATSRHRDIRNMSLKELDELWNEIKIK